MFLRKYMFVGAKEKCGELIAYLNEIETVFTVTEIGENTLRIETRLDLVERIIYFTRFKATGKERWLRWISA